MRCPKCRSEMQDDGINAWCVQADCDFSDYTECDGTDEADDMRCPTCNSPDPARHPAVQFEGEVEICRDPFHKATLVKVEGRLVDHLIARRIAKTLKQE